jgi:putative SOS response-associated peptidase YedK
MCGRYSLTRRQSDLIERFGIVELLSLDEEIEPRFNIAPSQKVPVVLEHEGKRALTMLKWGLIPFWTKDLATQKPVINARCETMATKPFFRQALKAKRCLIPADGFYEWRHEGKSKLPMYIHTPEREIFSFAGLWDEWRSPEGDVLRTCTIITTAANETMSAVHDRMPIIIRPEHEDLWLDPKVDDAKQLEIALEPLSNDRLQMYQVSTKVNAAGKESPDMVEPVVQVIQQSLFDQTGS